jgi:hypothetical protein
MIYDVQICKLPYQPFFFVHAAKEINGDIEDVWLGQDGRWTTDEDSPKLQLPFPEVENFISRFNQGKEQLHRHQALFHNFAQEKPSTIIPEKDPTKASTLRSKTQAYPEVYPDSMPDEDLDEDSQEDPEETELEDNQCYKCGTICHVAQGLEFNKGIDTCYDCQAQYVTELESALKQIKDTLLTLPVNLLLSLDKTTPKTKRKPPPQAPPFPPMQVSPKN